MQKIKDAAAEFLAHKRVGVTGVSRHPQNHGSNIVFQRLRDRGYKVFAVNPNTDEVEGAKSYPDLHSIDGGCPCMFGPTADVGHKMMRVMFSLNGNVPRQV